MNMNNLLSILGWVLFALTLIASYFEYAKKNDPEVADKMKHVGTFAEWAVSLQDTLDKDNPDKLACATEDVLQQAGKSGIKLTANMAKGAVEKAVADRKKPADKPKAASKPVMPANPDKLLSAVSDISQPDSVKPEPVTPSKPAATDDTVHDLLDDLEVK